jgi:hypothetical protein
MMDTLDHRKFIYHVDYPMAIWIARRKAHEGIFQSLLVHMVLICSFLLTLERCIPRHQRNNWLEEASAIKKRIKPPLGFK